MGTAAGKGSDFVVLTSDNPRGEDPLAIIHDALPGLRSSGVDFTIEPARERAINIAVRIARPGDIVLIAGKGHEKIQITGDGVVPFDDVAVAKLALHRAGFANEFMTSEPRGIAG
jgi:UDP-N-acetylmuramoyl-L-alanyl-D-glutamate--2,6-diaminopimelate ligase